MSEACNHDCASCSKACSDRKKDRKDFLQPPHELSHIKHVIAVVSGKGGVGKSLVSSMMAVLMERRGYKVALLDADVTGPSIPRVFGLREKAVSDDFGLFPVKSKTGISVMSINLLLDDETAPVVWRGPIITGTIKQFWTDVIWGEVDYLFIDMPPGTGDVPLTVFQSIPVDGIIVVTSPQELVSMIVAKSINMAKMMNIPVLGIVENMSYVKCPVCGKEYKVFGESKVDDAALRFSIPVLARIPIDPNLAKVCDRGLIELFENDFLDTAADLLEKLPSMQK